MLNLLSLCTFVCIFLHCPRLQFRKHLQCPLDSLTVVCCSHQGFRCIGLLSKSCTNRFGVSLAFPLFKTFVFVNVTLVFSSPEGPHEMWSEPSADNTGWRAQSQCVQECWMRWIKDRVGNPGEASKSSYCHWSSHRPSLNGFTHAHAPRSFSHTTDSKWPAHRQEGEGRCSCERKTYTAWHSGLRGW